MEGIHVLTNEHGRTTSITIDINTLRRHPMSGREVVDYITSLEDLEDIIDVEMSRNDEVVDWREVKKIKRMQDVYL